MNERGAMMKFYWQGTTEALGEEHVAMPLLLPQHCMYLSWIKPGPPSCQAGY
jgi:hypothetical protein